MNDINAHVARTRNANQRVHICAVHIYKSAGRVNYFADLPNVLFKNSNRIRIGKHQSCNSAVIAQFAQMFEVCEALGGRSDRLDRKSR